MVAATLALIASGLPDRSVAANWIAYTLLDIVIILLAVRMIGRFFFP